MNQKFSSVKGMNDVLPPQIKFWQRIEQTARQLFACYGYSEIRTPIVEDTALFIRSVGQATDVVRKEMYTFEDKSGRSLCLRPEETAPAARAYIEHGVANTEAFTRWFYFAPMFRYERMKAGRYRQFHQLGAEAYGSAEPSADVEIISLTWGFLKQLGISDVQLHLNTLGDKSTRSRYAEALRAHFAPSVALMSDDAKQTFERNPLRLLDSKEPALQELVSNAPTIIDLLDSASGRHFEELQRLLHKLSIPWLINGRLVRGLDYYTRTAFEFVYKPQAGNNPLGTADALCGGGRYDELIKKLGGPEKPAVGCSIGLERLVKLLETVEDQDARGPTLFIATFDGPLRHEAITAVMKLRNEGYYVDFDPRGGKLKRQLDRADKVNAKYLAIWGETEAQQRKLEVKALALDDAHPKKFTTVDLHALEVWLQDNASAED